MSTISTRGLDLLPRTRRFRRADLDFGNHVGMESPVVDFLWKWDLHVEYSWVESNEHMQWRAASSTFSQLAIGRFLDRRARHTVCQMILLYLSTFPLPWGLKAAARLVTMPRECKNSFSSSDMKAVPRLECTKEGFPKTENILVKCFLTVVTATSAQRKNERKPLFIV